VNIAITTHYGGNAEYPHALVLNYLTSPQVNALYDFVEYTTHFFRLRRCYCGQLLRHRAHCLV
jgi:hypothetical protein